VSIRLKASVKDGITKVKTLIKHPMENGLRKELETGKLVPAHFIEEVTCEHKGKVVMSAIWSGAISKNPYCAFQFKGGVQGDKIKLTWKDNKGQTDSKEVEIK
jgi:sulfur-oxidizing protein SoxZ